MVDDATWLNSTVIATGLLVVALLAFVAVLYKTQVVPNRESGVLKGSTAALRQPPRYSTGFPIFGNFAAFAKNPIGFIEQAYKDVGGVFTLNLLAEQCTFLIGHENHAPFFEATDEELAQAPVYSFMTPIFGKKVVYDAPLAKRRQQMRALGSFLKPALLKKYSEIIAKEAHDYFRKQWGKEGQINLLPSMAELIILTASATLLGPEIRNELFLEVSHLYEMLDKGLTPFSIFFPNAPIPAHKKRDTARKEMVKIFSKVIEKRRELERNDPEANVEKIDVLQKLMEYKYKDGEALSDEEITGMLIAMLFAGQHTSNITTTWTALFLLDDKRKGKEPNASESAGTFYSKVMQELSGLEPFPGAFARGEGINSDVLADEVNLYNCVKESIRMHPPLIMLMRRVMKDMVTPTGFVVPKGHRVIVSNAVAQRLDEVFPEPDKWNPDRWNEFDASKLPKYSFIGFGAGIHTCMGEPFAFMQIRTILTVLFSMYDLELISEFPEPNYEAMVVPPKGPNIVKYKLRAIGEKLSTDPIVSKKPEPKKVVESVEEANFEEDAIYSREEIAKHNKKDDLWIIVKGKVYDVTNYLDVHQGGDKAILKYGGQDATKGVYGPQHPGTVPTLLERYYIGRVKS